MVRANPDAAPLRRSSGQCERKTGRQRRAPWRVQSQIPSCSSQALRQRSIVLHAPTTVTGGADRIVAHLLGSSRKALSCLPGARRPVGNAAAFTPGPRSRQVRRPHTSGSRYNTNHAQITVTTSPQKASPPWRGVQMTQARAPLIGKKISTKRNGEATIKRTSAPSGVPKSLFPGRNVIAARHGPPKERGVRRLQAKAAHLAPAAVTANDEEAFTAQRETDPDDSANRDIKIRQGALPPSRASLHPTQSLQDGFGRIRDCPPSWPDNQRGVTPPGVERTNNQRPALPIVVPELCNHCRMAVKTARNRCRANLPIHSSR